MFEGRCKHATNLMCPFRKSARFILRRKSVLQSVLTKSKRISMDYLEETQKETNSAESLGFKVTKIVFYFLILTFSLVGNCLLVYIICFTKNLRRRASSLLILNLALCDAFTPLFSIPFDFALEENGYIWPYGGFLCHVIWPAATLTATCSSLTLAAISLDRYRLLLHPFKPSLTYKQIKLIIVIIFMISLIVVSPYASVLHFEGSTCDEKWPKETYRKAYTVVLFFVQYAFPLVFMTTMYSLALVSLHSIAGKTWRMRSFELKKEKKNEGERAKGELQKRRNRFTRRASSRLSFHVEKTNIRATKMFIAIVVIFAIFMLPNQIVWLWSDFGGGQEHPGLNQARIICWLFTYTNSVFNPIIFTIFNRDFRSGVLKIFRRLFCKRKPRSRKESRSSVSQRFSTNSTRFSVTEPSRLSDFYQITSAC